MMMNGVRELMRVTSLEEWKRGREEREGSRSSGSGG
jgi:hypothetical protein